MKASRLFVKSGQAGNMDKKCNVCGEIKDITEFRYRKKYDRYEYRCKKCENISNEIYRQKHKERDKEKNREYERLRCQTPERKASKKRTYKKYRSEILEKAKKYRKENKEFLAEQNKRWVKNNKQAKREYMNKYWSERRKEDKNFRLSLSLRDKLSKILKQKNIKKTIKTFDLIGCSIVDLRIHFEKQFQTGMTWENHGYYGWHIDHIRPISSFDLTDPEQQKLCFHYSNLQPLWAKDNLKKAAKLDYKVS